MSIKNLDAQLAEVKTLNAALLVPGIRCIGLIFYQEEKSEMARQIHLLKEEHRDTLQNLNRQHQQGVDRYPVLYNSA